MHSTLGYTIRSTNNRYDDNQRHLVTIVYDRTQATAVGQTTIYVDGVNVPKTIVASYNIVQTTNFSPFPGYI